MKKQQRRQIHKQMRETGPKSVRRGATAPAKPFRIGPLEVIAALSVLFLFVAYLWPQHDTYPDPLHRLDCFNRIQHVVAATLHSAMTHGGVYPNELQTCPEIRALDADDLICPSSNLRPYRGPQVAALNGGQPISYVYVGNGVTNTTSPDIVIWLEQDSNHEGLGMNVAFADGHIEWIASIDAQDMLKQVAAGTRPVTVASDSGGSFDSTTQP